MWKEKEAGGGGSSGSCLDINLVNEKSESVGKG